MTLRRKHLSAASLLILMIKVFSGQTLTCHWTEYHKGNRCCRMCLPGNRVKRDCTEYRSTSCRPCLEGTYMNQPTGLKQCFPCSDCDEGSGLKMKSSCTTTSDTVCEPLEGFYCVDPSDNGCGAAQKHRSCEPGQYISQKGTASTDSVCSDCSDGSFSDGSFPSCRPHTQCKTKNLQLLKPGTTSTDAECGEHSLNKTKIGISVSLSILLFVILAAVAFQFKEKIKSSLCPVKGNPVIPTEETNLMTSAV
ncbi:tumor necrosis factor receptor superfamily member 14-like isoform X2 [Anabas testudineus]|uniref:tumor necrosis factor receptor superfamily member 14-like isoform X2 n=1 Tax=Anabas testudineus TaxID=64144 RepID=UPI00143CF1CC|nr:tumor necrosis factor receptor superfamily member 14-like isoform X2 [Anabas testudineus]